MPIRPKRTRRRKTDEAIRYIDISVDGHVKLTASYPGVRWRVRGPESLERLITEGRLSTADEQALSRAVRQNILHPGWLVNMQTENLNHG